MTIKEKKKIEQEERGRLITIIILLLLAMSIFGSCKSTKYVEVPVEKVHTEYITNLDSVYLHDSIYIHQYTKNDTVYQDVYKDRYLYRTKNDTIVKTDSIDKPIYITKTEEVNHLYWWQKTLMWIGGVMMALGIGIIIYKIKFR